MVRMAYDDFVPLTEVLVPGALAVTVNVNGPTPRVVTLPELSTRASAVSLLCHASCGDAIVLPSEPVTTAVTLSESPAPIVSGKDPMTTADAATGGVAPGPLLVSDPPHATAARARAENRQRDIGALVDSCCTVRIFR